MLKLQGYFSRTKSIQQFFEDIIMYICYTGLHQLEREFRFMLERKTCIEFEEISGKHWLKSTIVVLERRSLFFFFFNKIFFKSQIGKSLENINLPPPLLLTAININLHVCLGGRGLRNYYSKGILKILSLKVIKTMRLKNNKDSAWSLTQDLELSSKSILQQKIHYLMQWKAHHPFPIESLRSQFSSPR